ncbi:MAG: hypothetical protein AAF798_11575 [Bacteroidota bacterium]
MKVLLFLFLILGYSLPFYAQQAVPVRGAQANCKYYESPLEVVDDKLLVKGQINNQQGYFMIDTGTPVIVINQKVTPGKQLTYAIGLHGKVPIGSAKVASLAWAGIFYQDITVASADLSNLERAIKRPLLGLIGIQELSNYSIIFDTSLGKIIVDHRHPPTLYEHSDYKRSIDFEVVGDLLAVSLTIGHHDYTFGIDTGAGSNLLNTNLQKELASYTTYSGIAELQGLDKTIHQAQKIYLNDRSSSDQLLRDQSFLFTNFSTFEHAYAISLDGFIGFPIFSGARFAFDFRQRQILFW